MFEPRFTIGSKIGEYTVTNFEREFFVENGMGVYRIVYELDKTIWIDEKWVSNRLQRMYM